MTTWFALILGILIGEAAGTRFSAWRRRRVAETPPPFHLRREAPHPDIDYFAPTYEETNRG